jgi:ketosteroid isomerase-like protein
MYAEWARGDYSRTDIFDPRISSRGYGIWPEGERTETHGMQELRDQMVGWLQSWERPFMVQADRFVQAGDRIAVLIRWRGRGKEGGTPIESEGAHVWTFRDGKAVRFDVYRDRDQALATVHEAGDSDH